MHVARKLSEVIDEIIYIHDGIAKGWKHGGDARGKARELIAQSMLDWQVELSRTLLGWVRKPKAGTENAHLIMAWANLGALVEGSMKLFLCVHRRDYATNPVMNRHKDRPFEPDELMLEMLKQFYQREVWKDDAEAQAENWNAFIQTVQQRRNAIHAFQKRDIGTLKEFRAAVRRYLDFLNALSDGLPPTDYDVRGCFDDRWQQQRRTR